MTQRDLILWWALAFFSGLAVVVGRLGYMLFGISSEPPADPAARQNWHRKRLWLTVSELSALPAFATAAVAAQVYFQFEPIVTVILSMVLGALGFGFLLNAVQRIARKRFQNIEDQT
jgi:hypothetical protein